jgi:hypothetical protein
MLYQLFLLFFFFVFYLIFFLNLIQKDASSSYLKMTSIPWINQIPEHQPSLLEAGDLPGIVKSIRIDPVNSNVFLIWRNSSGTHLSVCKASVHGQFFHTVVSRKTWDPSSLALHGQKK